MRDAFERNPPNISIMPKIVLKKLHYARPILAIFDTLFHACRQKVHLHMPKHNIALHQSVTNLQDIKER